MDARVEALENELSKVLDSLRAFEITVNGNTNSMTQMQDKIASRVTSHEEAIKRQIEEAATAASRSQEQQEEHRRNLQSVVDGCRLEFGSNQTRLLNIEGHLAPLVGAVGGGGHGCV